MRLSSGGFAPLASLEPFFLTALQEICSLLVFFLNTFIFAAPEMSTPAFLSDTLDDTFLLPYILLDE